MPDITPQSTDLFAANHPAPTPISPELAARCDASVAWLRQFGRSSLQHYALGVGEHVVDTWYDGDLLLYRDRRSPHHVGFEALLAHRKEELADLGLSAQTLRNYLLAYSAWRELPPATRERLELTHLHRLGRVVDPIARARLAHDAAEQGWPTRQLKAAIVAHKAELRGDGPKRGRPVKAKVAKVWGKALSAVRKAGKGKVVEVRGLEGKEKAALRAEVVAALAVLQGVLVELGDGPES